MNKLSLQSKKGFTLVEILIVVIIIGLLAGVAVVKLGDSKERAVVSVKKSIATELNKAVQAAYVKSNIISDAAVGAYGAGVTGVQDLIVDLQAVDPANPPFTDTSATEMSQGAADVTPNTGSLVLSGASHRDLEVVYSPGATPGS